MNKLYTLLAALMLTVSAGATFRFEVFDVTMSSAVVITIPDDPTVGYINSFLDLATYNTLTETQIAQEFKSYMDQYNSNYSGMCTFGNDSSVISGLDEDTEYVVFAYPLNMATGMPAAKFDTVHIHTASFSSSNNQLTLSYSAKTDEISILTTNNDPYFLFIDQLSYYTSHQLNFSESALTNQLASWANTMAMFGWINNLTFTGNQNLSVQWCFSHMYFTAKPQVGEEYVAMAVPYNGAVNGTPSYVRFVYGQDNEADGVEQVSAEVKATKVLRDGHLLLLRGDDTYTITGNRQ